MSTAISPPNSRTLPVNGSIRRQPQSPNLDQQFLIENADWPFYEGLLALIGKRRIRVTYDRGRLEIMAPSWNHEWWSRRLDRILCGVGLSQGIGFVGGGSTTFRREDLDRGLEPDQCYYTVNAQRMLGRRVLDLSVDPPPDLAIEIDFTRSSLNRMDIYAALGVSELWRWDEAGIQAFLRVASGGQANYEPSERSASFPMLPLDRLLDFIILTQNLNDVELHAAAHEWASSGFPPLEFPAGDSPASPL